MCISHESLRNAARSERSSVYAKATSLEKMLSNKKLQKRGRRTEWKEMQQPCEGIIEKRHPTKYVQYRRKFVRSSLCKWSIRFFAIFSKLFLSREKKAFRIFSFRNHANEVLIMVLIVKLTFLKSSSFMNVSFLIQFHSYKKKGK